MAKRPIKKRTQRKAVKKVLQFRVVTAKKPKVLNPKFKLKIGGDDGDVAKDPYFVHPETIPVGVALQWVANDRDVKPSIDQAISSGWKIVKGQDAIRGLVLMWAPQEIADAQRDDNIRRAQQQMQDAKAALGIDVLSSGRDKPFTLVSESFLASEPYQSVPSDTPPIDVDVTVKFRLSARFQEAAALLKITPEVYAKRRIALYLRGELGGILLPVHDGKGSGVHAFELFEDGNFNIQSRKF